MPLLKGKFKQKITEIKKERILAPHMYSISKKCFENGIYVMIFMMLRTYPYARLELLRKLWNPRFWVPPFWVPKNYMYNEITSTLA